MSNKLDGVAPPEIAQLYKALWEDVAGLSLKWRIYRQLFAGGQADLDVLSATAPSFFTLVHNMWIREVVRVIGCLTDPAQTAGKQNLSLLALVDVISKSRGSDALQRQVNQVLTACEFLRAHRNRNVSHHDLETRTGVAVVPLPVISRTGIDNALESISSLMNFVEYLFGVSKTDFGEETARHADGDLLVESLRTSGHRLD